MSIIKQVSPESVIGSVTQENTWILDMKDELLKCGHPIMRDENTGSLRWAMIEDDDDINCTVKSMHKIGLSRNHEIYRNYYRRLGYSLFGYWELFYWDVNNPDACNYKYKELEL